MKIVKLLLILVSAAFGANQAQAAFVPLRTDAPGENPTAIVLQQNSQEVQLEITLPGLDRSEGMLEGQNWDRIEIPGGGYELDLGAPEVPHFTRFLVIPATAAVQAQFEAVETAIITNITLMPAQGRDPADLKGPNPPAVRYDLGRYQKNELYPAQRVIVGEPAILRGLRVVSLRTNPVQYNPVTHELLVTTKFRVTVKFTGQDLRNVPLKSIPLSQCWANMVQALSFNYEDEPGDEAGMGSYLVIANADAGLQSYLAPLVDWKKRMGYSVTMQTFTGVPTNTIVKSWIQNAYNTWPTPPEFVLLVGDVDACPYQLPGWDVTSPYFDHDFTDYGYERLDGTDILPDVAVGRLPAINSAEAQTMINKILWYEKMPYIGNTNWYHQGVVIAGSSSSGFSTIQTNRYVKTRMIQNQYTRVDTFWYNMSGSVNTTLTPAFNNGILYGNYRGLGTMGNFYTSNIDALNNGRMLPLMVTLTCGTGGFEGDSFMEHFVVSGTAATPRAAVACIGTATQGTHTRYNNTVAMGVFSGIFDLGATEPGNALNYGKFQLWLTYGTNDFTQADNFSRWNALAGDPGLEMYTKAIQFMTCNVPDQVTYGVNSLTLTVNETGIGPLVGATACLYKEGEMQSVGLTDASGIVTLPLSVNSSSNVKVTITKQNFFPLVDSLDVVNAAVAVGYMSHTIDDDNTGGTSGDNDHVINPGETVDLPLTFKNYGTSTTATGILTTATETDPFATLSNSAQSFPDMAPGAQGNSTGAMRATVMADCPDGHIIPLAFNTTSNQGSWTGGLNLSVTSYDIAVLNAQCGGSDTLLSPGETADFGLIVKNTGHKSATNLTATLVSLDPLVTVNDNSGTFGTVNIGSTANSQANPFNLTASSAAPRGHWADLVVTFNANGAVQTDTIKIKMGNKIQTDPQGPDEYGYYCFDNTDVSYSQCPAYSWVEIDPTQGGQGTQLSINDPSENNDQSLVVNLPFTFRYYGQHANQITVCSNGWLSTVANNSFSDFRNYPIPSTTGPYAMIAPFWDDLITWSGGKVCTWNDAANHRFIVEWSRLKTLGTPQTQEIFEVILLDPAYYSTPTGDGEIIFQYYSITHIYGISDDNPYSTIGIESPEQLTGIETMYWNSYHDPAAAPIVAGRAMKFTTAFTIQPPALDVTLTPTNPPIVVPANGGSFNFTAAVLNGGPNQVPFPVWARIKNPDGTYTSNTLGPVTITPPVGVSISRVRTQNIPSTWAPGVYTYLGYANTAVSYPAIDSSSFTFTKSTSVDGGPIVWDAGCSGDLFPGEIAAVSLPPTNYALGEAKPNPFNPTTTLSYQLSANSYVRLRVYDTTGRLVAVLVDGRQEAGSFQVGFDGSKLASGLYFIRLEAGDFTATRKMMLVK